MSNNNFINRVHTTHILIYFNSQLYLNFDILFLCFIFIDDFITIDKI